jgi:iron complex outermembrane receptor protein
MKRSKLAMLVGVSVSVLMVPVSAGAQVSTDTDVLPTEAENGSQTPPSSTDAPEGGVVEDIIVTAQKRAESLQDVPLAISAITADSLGQGGAVDTKALTSQVPGLNIGSVGPIALVFLRGVGNSNITVGDEGAVSLYIDGVYQASPVGQIAALNNVERIEVIKGPQGTLFGRNATGGVVSIITKNPKHDPSLEASLSYANYDTITANLYATTGISDNFATNVAVYYSDQGEGWGKNLFNGSDVYKTNDFAVRSKWLFDNGVTRITLAGDYGRGASDFTSYRVIPPAVLVGQPQFPGYYNVRINDESAYVTVNKGFALTVEQDFDLASLKSITAYRSTRSHLTLDQDSTASEAPSSATNLTLELDYFIRTFSQELQILSPASSDVSWVAGAFIYKSEAGHDRDGFQLVVNNPIQTTFAELKTSSYAAFGQATVPLFASTRVTVGGRYTIDHRDLWADRRRLPSNQVVAGFPTEAEKTFKKFTYRFAIDHNFTPDVLAYASLTRGFKSGFYNTASPFLPGTLTPFEIRPEVLDSYEVGLKSDLLDRSLRVNISAFLYEYRDIQVAQNIQGATFVRNAAEAKVKGIDLDVTYFPVENLELNLSTEYLDARYKDFPDAPIYTLNPAGGDFPPGSFNAKGNRLVYAPEWSGRFAARYTIPTESGDLRIQGDYYYNHGFPRSVDNRLWQDSYSLLGATISWTSPDESWELLLWGKNLTKSKYILYAVQTAPYGDHGGPAAPRTYGITARMRLGR